ASQGQLEDLVLDLLPQLKALHAQQRAYGLWSLQTVFLDPVGRAKLLPGVGQPFVKQGTHVVPGTEPFSAIELQTDDTAWRIGPWTDVYGLGALLRAMICEQTPQSPVRRFVKDTQEPLAAAAPAGYSRQFLRTVDLSTVLQSALRLQSVDELSAMMGLSASSQSMPAAPSAPGGITVPGAVAGGLAAQGIL